MIARREIFVFGSNEAGRHGAGAALWAKQNRGAVYGQGFGLQGDSFGIPTKTGDLKTLSLTEIEVYVRKFFDFAHQHKPDMIFLLTPIGCGLAGYKKPQMTAVLKRAGGLSENVVLTREWLD